MAYKYPDSRLRGIHNYWLGKKRSLEDRKKMSIAKQGKHLSPGTEFKKGSVGPHKGKKRLNISGKNHWNWRGGISNKNKIIRGTVEYKQWREAVFERDKYTCQWCNDKSTKGHYVYIEADHIKPFAFYPELRFDINNGRTLCRKCHMKTDTFLRQRNPETGQFLSAYIKPQNEPEEEEDKQADFIQETLF